MDYDEEKVIQLLNAFQVKYRHKFKTFRDTKKRDFRSDIRELRVEVKSVQESMTFINTTFEEITGNFK